MAATSAALAATTGSATLVSSARGATSSLSSGNAFRTTSVVKFAPLSSKRCSRAVAARATHSEDSKDVGRDVTVSILAAGVALGFSASVVEVAFANPIDVARSKANTTLNSAKNAASNLPSAPSPGGAVEEAQKGAENLASNAKDQFGGIFSNAKPGPSTKSGNTVASSNGGTGSAIGDAQKRIANFGTNPIAKNIEEGSKSAENTIASAQNVKPNSQRVDEATKNVEKLGSDLQGKGDAAISEGKSLLDGQTQGSIPSFPNLFPKLDAPNLPTPDFSKVKDLKSGVESEVENAKNAAGNILQK